MVSSETVLGLRLAAGESNPVDIAAKVIVLILIICFTIFASAVFMPKLATAAQTRSAEQSSSTQWRKKGKAKKGSKKGTRNVTLAKPLSESYEDKVQADLRCSDDTRDGSLEPLTKDSSSLEAELEEGVLLQVKSLRAAMPLQEGNHCHLDHEDPTEVSTDEEGGNYPSTNETEENACDHLQEPACHCGDANAWGCAIHSQYGRALLLVHRDTYLHAVKTCPPPPGLELQREQDVRGGLRLVPIPSSP